MVTEKVPVATVSPGRAPGAGEFGQKVLSIRAAMFWPATEVASWSSALFCTPSGPARNWLRSWSAMQSKAHSMPASARCLARAVSERLREMVGSTAPRLSTVRTSMVKMRSAISARGRATPRWSRMRARRAMIMGTSRSRSVTQAHAVDHGHRRLACALLCRYGDGHRADIRRGGRHVVVLIEIGEGEIGDAGRDDHRGSVHADFLARELARGQGERVHDLLTAIDARDRICHRRRRDRGASVPVVLDGQRGRGLCADGIEDVVEGRARGRGCRRAGGAARQVAGLPDLLDHSLQAHPRVLLSILLGRGRRGALLPDNEEAQDAGHHGTHERADDKQLRHGEPALLSEHAKRRLHVWLEIKVEIRTLRSAVFRTPQATTGR